MRPGHPSCMTNEPTTVPAAVTQLQSYRAAMENHSLLCARQLWIEAGSAQRVAEELFEELVRALSGRG